MSAAFDTVDHDVLVTRLVQRFGVTGCAIAWIKSYLADRSQSVNINGGVSNDTPLAFGVPQELYLMLKCKWRVTSTRHAVFVITISRMSLLSGRSCLTEQAAIRLVHSLVVSRLDYGNALLFGIPDVLIGKLQRVQNYAARLVVRCDRRDHITHVLKKLHWLPVKQRVTYKILLLTFNALNGLAPIYIVDMLHRH